jgi:hypothetical protein
MNDDMKFRTTVQTGTSGFQIQYGDIVVGVDSKTLEDICNRMVELGMELISEPGKVTVEYFRNQSIMYYAQLNAYISNQTLKSNERKNTLNLIMELANNYGDLINRTDAKDKIEALKFCYEKAMDSYTESYRQLLGSDVESQIPEPRSLLRELQKIFFKNK